YFNNLLPKEDYFSRALYTFDIGQNDLTAGYKLNLSTEQVKAYVPDLLSQLSTVIKLVYALGGRSFWIHNTGPVGCLPYVMDRFLVTAAQIDKYGCSSPYNDVSKYFNLKLKDTPSKGTGQVFVQLLLVIRIFLRIFTNLFLTFWCADVAGFENPFLVCCGHGGKYNYNALFKCGVKNVVKGKESVIAKSCVDPSVRISWDGAHFTEAANKWIFDQIVNGSFSDPPVQLDFACNRMQS
ncbi:GDSL esterase/lipase, partial [Striga asiatica]